MLTLSSRRRPTTTVGQLSKKEMIAVAKPVYSSMITHSLVIASHCLYVYDDACCMCMYICMYVCVCNVRRRLSGHGACRLP